MTLNVDNMRVLPFSKNPKFSYLHDRYFSIGAGFKIFTKYGEILPFFAPLDESNLKIEVIDFYGEVVYSYAQSMLPHKIVSRENKKYFQFDGGAVQCFDLEPCYIPYRIRMGTWYSEYFFIGGDGMTKFEFSSSNDVFDLPYSNGFKQWFYLPLTIKYFELDTFQNVERGDNGISQVKYSRTAKNYDLVLSSIPAFIKNVFESARMVDNFVIINQDGEELKIDQVDSDYKFQMFEESFNVWDMVAKLVTNVSWVNSDCEANLYSTTSTLVNPTVINPTDCIPLERLEKLKINC